MYTVTDLFNPTNQRFKIDRVTSYAIIMHLVFIATSCGYQLNPYRPISQGELRVSIENQTPYPSAHGSVETAWERWADDRRVYHHCASPHLVIALDSLASTWKVSHSEGVRSQEIFIKLTCHQPARSLVAHTTVLFSIDGRHSTQARLADALDMLVARLVTQLRDQEGR